MTVTRLPGISGMQKIEANKFLVIHDAKGGADKARLGVLQITSEGPVYKRFELTPWPSDQDLPNDIEGVCAIPGRDSEYLIAESGYYPCYGNFGRIIRIRLRPRTCAAEYAGQFRPFEPPLDKAETKKPDQIEGIQCVGWGGKVVLLIARRGHKEKPGTLVWGGLAGIDDANPTFTITGSHELTPVAKADRGAADLLARPSLPGFWEVLSVASVDSGDLGPFRSSIYCAGLLRIDKKGTPSFVPHTPPSVLWKLEGLKVEALAAAAELVTNSFISIATDDENYGGLWRPLLKTSGPTQFTDDLLIAKVLSQ